MEITADGAALTIVLVAITLLLMMKLGALQTVGAQK